jgi:hypothetical protein
MRYSQNGFPALFPGADEVFSGQRRFPEDDRYFRSAQPKSSGTGWVWAGIAVVIIGAIWLI